MTNTANGKKDQFIGLQISAGESGKAPEMLTLLFHPGHLQRILPKLQATLQLVSATGTDDAAH